MFVFGQIAREALLADPGFDLIPSQGARAVRIGFGRTIRSEAELPFVQVLHAIQSAENAQRFKGRKGVARAAVNVVFVVAPGTGRIEKSSAMMPAQDTANALFPVNLVQATEDFQRGQREIGVLQRRLAWGEEQTAHVAPVVDRRLAGWRAGEHLHRRD